MGKRLAEVEKIVDKTKQYTVEEAVDLIKKIPKTKFDETVELHMRLGIDPKQSNQLVRGTVVLPHGIGKVRRVIVIAQGEKLKEAETAGADHFGSKDLIEKISKGWLEFDIIVATPDTMRDLGKLGKLLGPKGLMPSPKAGTVTFDISKTVKELKSGRVEFKNDSAGIVHCSVGKVSFDREKLVENVTTLIDTIVKAKPPSSKGIYVRSITLTSTMGPGIKIIYTQK